MSCELQQTKEESSTTKKVVYASCLHAHLPTPKSSMYSLTINRASISKCCLEAEHINTVLNKCNQHIIIHTAHASPTVALQDFLMTCTRLLSPAEPSGLSQPSTGDGSQILRAERSRHPAGITQGCGGLRAIPAVADRWQHPRRSC